VGYLIGEEHQGMRYMFKMMNNARLGVGVEGLAVTERALQQAAEFALERRQGTAVGAPRGEQSVIVEHADVRRMLLTMRAYTDAMRCLLYLNSSALDTAGHHPDPEISQAASERAELLTPISKAWCTDIGVEMASIGIQVHGGYGYIEETGAAQHYRDARISPIYEGTNGIQAIDLVGRKLSLRAGGVMGDLLDEIAALDAALAVAGEEFDSIRSNLADGLAAPYLKMFGQVVGGWLLARLALGARRRLDEGVGNTGHLEGKIVAARFYAEQLLPIARAQLGAVTAGAEDLFAISADGFSV
jgi:hypothetical protein